MEFINKIINYMKKLMKKISRILRQLFGDMFDFLRGNSQVAVKVTANLKSLVESQLLDIATDIIPGDIDDKILKKARVIVPKVATQVAIVHGIIDANDKKSDAVASIIEYLRKLNPDARVSFWIEFSAKLNVALSDDELDLFEAVVLAQLAYGELNR